MVLLEKTADTPQVSVYVSHNSDFELSYSVELKHFRGVCLQVYKLRTFLQQN